MPKPGGGKLTEKVEVIRAINAVVNWNKRSVASTMHVTTAMLSSKWSWILC